MKKQTIESPTCIQDRELEIIKENMALSIPVYEMYCALFTFTDKLPSSFVALNTAIQLYKAVDTVKGTATALVSLRSKSIVIS